MKKGIILFLAPLLAILFTYCKNSDTLRSFSLSADKRQLSIGETLQLRVDKTTPSNYPIKNIVWHSSNESIASVSATGEVTAKNVGEVTIKATCEGITASCLVTVVPVEVSSIRIDTTELILKEKETHQFNVTVLPDNATAPSFIWESKDPNIASITNCGLLTAKEVGETEITVCSEDGLHTATCQVTVIRKEYRVVEKLLLPFLGWGEGMKSVRNYEKKEGGTEKSYTLYDEYENTYYLAFDVEPSDEKPIVCRGYVFDKKIEGKLIASEILFPLECIFEVYGNGGGNIRSEFTNLLSSEGFTPFSLPLAGVVQCYANKGKNLFLELRILTMKETGETQYAGLMVLPYDSLF